jgi:hypothetical protein
MHRHDLGLLGREDVDDVVLRSDLEVNQTGIMNFDQGFESAPSSISETITTLSTSEMGVSQRPTRHPS